MFSILFAFFSLSTFASVYQGEIARIDYPRTNEKDTLIFLNDGKVLKVDESKSNSIFDLEIAKRKRSIIQFTINPDRTITHFNEVDSSQKPAHEIHSLGTSYEPTILASAEEAKTVFKGLRRGASAWSQCYNRAHIWSYESKNKFNLDSMKVFTFYTRKYIREYNFDWWFHVAPFTYVKAGEEIEERVLDPMFAKGPLKTKDWTDIFMRNKVTCPVISKYSEYENNEEASYCYLYKASMFYLQPLDLDRLERSGVTKSEWLNYEVRRAYRNGFNIW